MFVFISDDRQEVECNLTFLGFIIFENKLKTRTVSALTTLRNANIRQIMCTGRGGIVAGRNVRLTELDLPR